MNSEQLRRARLGRWAVAAMFFVNGFLTGSWALQIPELVTRFKITETTLGQLILVFGLGALAFMPLAGMAMSRFGSQRILRLFGALCVVALLPVGLAPNLALLAIAVFFYGGMTGAMDVAMNSNAVAVEKGLSKAIMSSSHGFWSLGGFIGGGAGGYAILHYGFLPHIIGATIVAVIIFVAAWPFVIADEPHPQEVQAEKPRVRLPRSATVYLVGIVALFAMIPEGAVLDWAALYLQKELGADIATAGLAFSFFAGTMAVLRFLGDTVRNRLGAVLTLRLSSLIAGVGILTAALSTNVWVVIFAFSFAGIGIANIVPIAFSAAGNQPGMAASTGMSVVTTMGYSGILLAPSLIGFAAEHVGFSNVYMVLAAMLVVVFALSPLVRSADFGKPQVAPGPETF